jgi:Arc/MetJ family transcription regulator
MHMRTTLNIDDRLLEKAARLSGIREKTAVVRAGLEALIARQSAKRLAALGGTEPALQPIRRRRSGSGRSSSSKSTQSSKSARAARL